mmetsp:Transcript_25495/g.48213  ORF Transcript_25495/g.48213 Transcript_25495/m.48213 type:complete len:142 (-) Transcript_25495:527-952(-)
MRLCRSGGTQLPWRSDLVQATLISLRVRLPGVVLCALLGPSGVCLAQDSDHEVPLQSLLAQVSLVKRSLLELGDALGSATCPVLHIKGSNHMLSCHNVGENVLVMVSQMHQTSVELLDTVAAEDAISGDLARLKQLLGIGQ